MIQNKPKKNQLDFKGKETYRIFETGDHLNQPHLNATPYDLMVAGENVLQTGRIISIKEPVSLHYTLLSG